MCKKHKKYKAIKKPKANCEECWKMYFNKHTREYHSYKSSISKIDANTFPYSY